MSRLLRWMSRVWPIRHPRGSVSSACRLAPRGRRISLRRSSKEHINITSICRSRHLQAGGRARSRAATITQPFPVQQLVIRDALAGHDLLVQSPTGSGKTLAFGIPMVERLDARARGTAAPWSSPRPASSPARSSTSSARSPAARGLKIAAVYGGVGFGPQIKAARDAPTSSSPPPAASRT